MLIVDAKRREKLQNHRISTLHQGDFSLPDQSVFEPPCSIKWMQIHHSIAMRAFSYAVSGYFFAVRIARYVSVGEQVSIGRHNHPTSWSSTSPFFCRPHSAVLDFPLEEARDVRPRDFMLGEPGQRVRTTSIGNDVWIGHGAFVSPGVTIGDGAVVAAHAVVTKDVPPYAIVVGVPAVVRKMRFSDKIIERMISIKWWRYAFWDLRGASTTQPELFLDAVEAKMSKGLQEYRPKEVHVSDLFGSISPARRMR